MYVAEMERRDRQAAEMLGGDDEPDPPAGGGLPVPEFAAEVAALRDDVLIAGISMADDGGPGRGWCYFLGINTPADREAYLAAASAELLKRLDARQPLAA
jgi:hypothetical protein